MKDLTQGPIQGHIIAMAGPIAAGMLIQTLYFLVDLYFVGRLGDAALAGVGSAGNVMFIIMALTQALGVGAVTLISHAVGRKDQPDANLVFNQSLSLAALFVVVTLLGGYGLGGQYARSIGADAATAAAGSASARRWPLRPSPRPRWTAPRDSIALRARGGLRLPAASTSPPG